jgi:fructose-1,6-bisphosphatase-3
VDIIPKVSVVRTWDRPRKMADTERGDQIRCEIRLLERLIEAYRNNDLRQRTLRPWSTN